MADYDIAGTLCSQLNEVFFKGKTIEVHADSSGIYAIILSDPQARNALGPVMRQEIKWALEQLSALPADRCRVLIWAARGPVFCAGANLTQMRSVGRDHLEGNTADAFALGQLFFECARFPAPVLGLVHGAAMGGGLGLVACCDFVWAAPGCQFALSEVRLGLVPGVISPYVLRKMSVQRAAIFMMSGEKFDSIQAQDWGLVNEPLSASWLVTLRERCTHLLRSAPEAVRSAKELLLRNCPLPSEALQNQCASQIARARASAEATEGIAAFFEKRSPHWVPDFQSLFFKGP